MRPIWWKKELTELPRRSTRAEAIAEKPMFRPAFKSRRCVIPASGFYEWTGPKGDHLPWYTTAADGKPLSFAGLCDKFNDPETGEERLSATIIVCEANKFMSKIYNRMPVALDRGDIDAWLAEPRGELLKPAPETLLSAVRVGPKVNSSRYTEADAVEPVE